MIGHTGALFMLHKMSEARGWSHESMMKMNKRVFYRYYGYWYQDRLFEEMAQEQQELEMKRKQKTGQGNNNWKQL